jgi:hypothetical protein
MSSDERLVGQPDAGILQEEFPQLSECEQTADQLGYRLDRIVARHPIEGVLDKIVSNRERIRALMGFAYGHKNGFDKFIIDSLGDFMPRLRLHVWWNPNDSRESTVHNHPWDFASVIMAGRLVMRRYKQTEEAGLYRRFRFPTKANQASRDAVFEGCSGVSCTEELRFERGDSYSLSHSELHSVIASKGALVTLVLQGKHVADYSIVYARTSDPEQSPAVSRYFSEDEIQVKLNTLKCAIRRE